MSEDPKDKIVRIMRDSVTGSMVQQPGYSVSVTGTGNITAIGDIHMGLPPRPKVTVKTGDGTIDAKQKAEITRRVKNWVEVNNAVRIKKLSLGAAWSALNSAMGVHSYHELRPEQMPAAVKWLTEKRGRVLSMKSAPTKAPSFRASLMSAIKARSKQLGDLHYYTPYIVKNFGVSSLAHLSDLQLQQVRRWILGQKR